MKTTVKFLGLTEDGFAICEVENRVAVTYVEYDTLSCEVLTELAFDNTHNLIEVYNPLSIMDVEVIIEWFNGILN